MENRPLYITTEQRATLPVLIVDKKGTIGKGLARLLRDSYLVVLVTGDSVETHENVIHIPYPKKIPVIPDNTYSHLFVIYNGEKEIVDMLPSFLAKAEQTKSRLLFICSLFECSERLFTQLSRMRAVRLQVIVYGELFAQRNREPNAVNYYLQQMQLYGRIALPNAGLGQLYPIFYEDAIRAIVAVGFHTDLVTRLFYVFPQYPFTEVAVARIIQKHNPLLKIDYTKKKVKAREFFIPPGGHYLFPSYDLDAKIKALELEPVTHIDKLSMKQYHKKPADPEAQKRRLVLFCTLLFSLFIAPILVTFFLALVGGGFLSLSLKQAESGNVITASQTAQVAGYAFSGAQALVPSLVLPSIVFPDKIDQFAQNMQTAGQVVETERDGLAAVLLFQNIYQDKSTNPHADFRKGLAILKNTLLTFQKMKAENSLPPVITDKVQKYASIMQRVEGTIDIWPQLFGFEGKKTYMVLFQNNMELRPGGGFIGSYALLTLHNGKATPLHIFDVYDADGKLKTSLTPPYGLGRYLGAKHWFLRDSNYDVDFLKNAIHASDFLQRETGEHVDGVIAIDTTFLKNLLAVFGSVSVPDYHEVVTPDTFYLETEKHAENNFFPGSTQKKDFLRSLATAMLDRLSTRQGVSYENVLQVLETSIQEKHFMAATFDAGLQNILAVNGLSSSPRDTKLRDPNIIDDFFGVIDANVGANKANYYLKRSIRQDRRFDDAGGLQASAEVTYVNNSTPTSPFGGEYKDYVRFLLPDQANIQSIFIDNQEQQITPAVTDPAVFTDSSFVPPNGLEVEHTQASDRTVVGFFFIVPKGQTKKITISYRMTNAIDLGQPTFLYKLNLFKQPGTQSDDYVTNFSYPQNFTMVSSTGGAVNLGGKLVYETNLNEDKSLMVTLSHK